MRYGFAMLTVVAWGLWFGGMGALFLFVSYLFVQDRATAVVAAPRLFEVFEAYQYIVGGVALVSATLWRMVSPGRTSISVIFLLFVLAAVGLMVTAIGIRRPMERLRAGGQSAGAEFHRLHRLSERVYSGQAMALLAAGVILPVALAPPRSERRRTAPEAEPPTTPPGEPADRAASP